MVVNAKLVSEYMEAPIIFDDSNGANEILQKLETIDEIKEAYVFSKDGSIFTKYIQSDSGDLTPEYKNIEWAGFEGNNLLIYQPIKYLDEQYGTIHLKISTSILSKKITEQISIMILFSVLILIMSWLLASRMQRLISKPILELANVTYEISKKGDYSIRVIKQNQDEIGELYDQFNLLIERIQKQQVSQKTNEDALRRSEEKFRHIFENSIVGIYRNDIETGEVIEANDAAIKILKLNHVNERKMKNMFQYIDDHKKLIHTLKSKGVVDNFETKLKRGDGKLIWVSISGKIYEDGKYYEGVLQDVTLNKENYLNLQKANFELDNFVYHTSHDLRSPLLSILGLVNIAKTEKDVVQLLVVLEMIEKSIKKLDSLVNDLLVLSRDNRINDPLTEIDINEQVQECIENFDFLENFERIDIKTNIVESAPFVSDRTRFSVIINNLLSNAIKYSRTNSDNAFIHISVRVDKVKCVLKIEDNGEGISKDLHNKIFDMFFRATESSNGSGLGLYIVKNVSDKLGAKIDFESTPKVGSTFTVTIPNNSESIEVNKEAIKA